MDISISRLARYQRCPYSYHLHYEEGLRPIRRPNYIDVGLYVHTGIEAGLLETVSRFPRNAEDMGVQSIYARWKAHRDDPTISQLYENNPEALEEDSNTVARALAVFRRASRNLGLFTDRWETQKTAAGKPAIELPVVEEYTARWSEEDWTDYKVRGIVDWVAKDNEDGLVKVLDFKTTKGFIDEEAELFDTQLPIYQHMLREYPWEIQGSGRIQIKSSVPAIPKTLKPKKGKPTELSRAKISTDRATYESELDRLGIDKEPYAEHLEKIDSTEWERHTVFHRTDEECKAIFDNLIQVAIERKSRTRTMNPYNCKNCEFRMLCNERLTGRGEGDLELYGLTKQDKND